MSAEAFVFVNGGGTVSIVGVPEAVDAVQGQLDECARLRDYVGRIDVGLDRLLSVSPGGLAAAMLNLQQIRDAYRAHLPPPPTFVEDHDDAQ